MGLILDSSVLIAAERCGMTAWQTVAQLAAHFPGEEVAISVITMFELAHGVERANTSPRRSARQRFLDEIVGAVPIHPLTLSMALQAGRIDGLNTARGIRVALADLLIGVTALELGYQVATSNLRHFQMIPGLTVLPV